MEVPTEKEQQRPQLANEQQTDVPIEQQQPPEKTTQPEATAAMTLRGGGNAKHKDWEEDLFRCSKTCCIAACCGPCVLQKNQHRYEALRDRDMDTDTDAFCSFCGPWCFFQCFLEGTTFKGVLPYLARRQTREHFHINGSRLGDICFATFCSCFTLAQESEQLKEGLDKMYSKH